MRKLIQYGLVLIPGGILFLLCYHFIDTVTKPTPELHFSLKAFASTGLELRTCRVPNGDYQDDPTKFFLNASQFYSKIVMSLDHDKELNRVRIDFDNQPNNLLIEKVYLVTKQLGDRDTLTVWKGGDVDSLISRYHNIRLETKNQTMIQFICGETDPYLEFNARVSDTYHLLSKPSQSSLWLKYAGSLLLALTFLMMFRYTGNLDIADRLRYSLVKGQWLQRSFFLILFITFLNSQLRIIPDKKNTENRKLATAPELSTGQFFEFPELYSSYTKDNYAFRNYFAFAHAVMSTKVFHTSPLPDDVIMGKKDWFFDNEINVIKDFRKLQRYDMNQIDITTQILMQRKNWLAKRNIKFYIIIPPNKNRIYPELMPDEYFVTGKKGHNYLDLLSAHLRLHSNVRIIDPTPQLMQAKAKNDVYYSTDTHWNLYGGFFGYRALIDAIQKDFPAIRPVAENEFMISSYFNSEGDLAKMCGLQDVYKRKEYVLNFIDTSKHILNPESSTIDLHYENKNRVDSSNLKLVMFRDSYANYLIPFLNLHFREANYLWSYEFLDKVIEREKPDVVIFESLQRFMGYALTIPNSDRVVYDTLINTK